MKKILVVFGYMVSTIIIIGTMFKLQHWPGSGILLTAGLFMFAVLFIPAFFINRIIENHKGLNIATNILGLFCSSLVVLGVLFKVMHWPGSGLMIVLGSSITICPTIALFIIQQTKENEKRFSEYWKTVFAIFFISVFFIFYGLSYTRGILETYLKTEDNLININNTISRNNTLLLLDMRDKFKVNEFTKLDSIDKNTRILVSQIETLKKEIIRHVDGDNNAAFENHWNINSKDNYDIPTHIIGMSNSNEGIKLYRALCDYQLFLINAVNDFENNKQFKQRTFVNARSLELDLTVDKRMGFYENQTWQEYMFYQMPLVCVLSQLTFIQNQVLNAEYNALFIFNRDLKASNYL